MARNTSRYVRRHNLVAKHNKHKGGPHRDRKKHAKKYGARDQRPFV